MARVRSETKHYWATTPNGMRIPIAVLEPSESARKDLALLIYGGSKGFHHGKLNGTKELIAEAGYPVASFDFRGVAPLTMAFEESGIATRIEDAEAVLMTLKAAYPERRITVIGASMGGFVASFLLKYQGVRNAILIAPCAYADEALQKRTAFTDEFSNIIRRKGSWENSRSFGEVAEFSGSLLIIRFERDNVVSAEITQRYHDAVLSTPDKEMIDLPYGHHGTFRGDKMKQVTMHALHWLGCTAVSNMRGMHHDK